MKIKTFILPILSLLFLVACSPSKLSPIEYINWVDNPENKMIKEYIQNDTKLTCQYTPSEYTVLKQNGPNTSNTAEITENIEALSDQIQFKLKFQNTNSNNFLKSNYTTAEEFNTKSMYLSYDIRTDLKLVNGTDTVICVLNHHERTYGNTPFETILISFPKQNNKVNDLTLIFNDRVFGLGRVKFLFPKSKLSAIPKMVL